MKIGGDYRVVPYANTWPRAAGDLGLNPAQTVERVVGLCERAPEAVAEAASAPEVKSLDRPLPSRLVDLVATRAQQCLALVRESPSLPSERRGD